MDNQNDKKEKTDKIEKEKNDKGEVKNKEIKKDEIIITIDPEPDNKVSKKDKDEIGKISDEKEKKNSKSNLVRPGVSYASTLKNEMNKINTEEKPEAPKEQTIPPVSLNLPILQNSSKEQSFTADPKTSQVKEDQKMKMTNLLKEFNNLKTKSTIQADQVCFRPNEIKELKSNEKSKTFDKKDENINRSIRPSTSTGFILSQSSESNQQQISPSNLEINQKRTAIRSDSPLHNANNFISRPINNRLRNRDPTTSSESDSQIDSINLQMLSNSLQNEFKCSICMQVIVNATSLVCSHIFCKTCIDEWLKKNNNCPSCRRPQHGKTHHVLAIDNFISFYYQNFTDEDERTSRSNLVKDHTKKQAISDSRNTNNTDGNYRSSNFPFLEPELFDVFRHSRTAIRARQRRNQNQRRERARRLDRVDGISQFDEAPRFTNSVPEFINEVNGVIRYNTPLAIPPPPLPPPPMPFSQNPTFQINHMPMNTGFPRSLNPGEILPWPESNLSTNTATSSLEVQPSENIPQLESSSSTTTNTTTTSSTSAESNEITNSDLSVITRIINSQRRPRRRSGRRSRRARNRNTNRRSRGRSARKQNRSRSSRRDRGSRRAQRRSRTSRRTNQSRSRASNRRERSRISRRSGNTNPTRRREADERRRRRALRRVRRERRSSINDFLLDREH